jgi:curli production assembly/transport component CsgG
VQIAPFFYGFNTMRRLLKNHYFPISFLLALLFLSSCGTFFYHPLRTSDARLGETTPISSSIKELPAPKDPVIVAVYSFKDQTGQYKLQEGGSGFSTAVTQGASNILIKTLEDSKWFVPIERENIGDLLNERKIIRSTRQQFGLNEELPGLLYAGMLLEGGIVSYDANVITGGAGLRYFGTGGSSQYRQDRITVYLRAVSVTNGKILKTVYASKMILSQSIDGGVFKYVKFKRLLEAETGFTYNEPSELAVTEAIEKAVESLIFEGLQDELWEMKDPKNKKELLEKYKDDKEANEKIDIFSQVVEDRRNKGVFSLAGSTLLYKGDFSLPKPTFGADAGFGYNFSPSKGLELRAGIGSLATKSGFKTNLLSAELNFKYRYTPYYSFSPNILVGLGATQTNISNQISPMVHLGTGIEWKAKKNIGIWLSGDYHHSLSDILDNREHGSYNDAYYRANLGLHFYFGKKVKNTKKVKQLSSEKPKGPLQNF